MIDQTCPERTERIADAALSNALDCIETALYRCSWKDLASGAVVYARHGRDTGGRTALCNLNPSGSTREESHVRPTPSNPSGATWHGGPLPDGQVTPSLDAAGRAGPAAAGAGLERAGGTAHG